mgnify:CR=1 FL=1|jgi:XRE family transcriptional regulator, regulator of sulfur utilization
MDRENRASRYLAQNIGILRRKKNFSQHQLAQLAEIPRSTLTNIESGVGNPSLRNLIKISTALGVGVEELLSRPRSECTLIPAHKVKFTKRTDGKVRSFSLLPDKIKGIEIDRVEFEAQTDMVGHPHLRGTKEYLTVITGEVVVYVAGDSYLVKEGDVFAFPGNQPHSYKNPKNSKSVVVSVVIPVPASS